MFRRLLARALIFNRLRGIWPKGYQRGRLLPWASALVAFRPDCTQTIKNLYLYRSFIFIPILTITLLFCKNVYRVIFSGASSFRNAGLPMARSQMD